MDTDLIECELAERDPGMLREGPSLEVLKQVHKAYEARMELVDKMAPGKKEQLQVDLLRRWVGDLVNQNTLLARAVEELEAEATTMLYLERRKHSEMLLELRGEVCALRRRLARKDADVAGLVEVLRRLRDYDCFTLDGIHFFEVTETDIFGSALLQQNKEEQGDVMHTKAKYNLDNIKRHRREIRKLHKDVQQYEQTILNLRSEISAAQSPAQERISKQDAEVMAGLCCTSAEGGDSEPVKEVDAVFREEMVSYQERIHKMEENLKSSSGDVRALRTANVSLREELRALRGACAALAEQASGAAQRAAFKDDIIRELRHQLKRTKAQSVYDTASSTPNASIVDEQGFKVFYVNNCSIPQDIIREDSLQRLEDELLQFCNECKDDCQTCPEPHEAKPSCCPKREVKQESCTNEVTEQGALDNLTVLIDQTCTETHEAKPSCCPKCEVKRECSTKQSEVKLELNDSLNCTREVTSESRLKNDCKSCPLTIKKPSKSCLSFKKEPTTPCGNKKTVHIQVPQKVDKCLTIKKETCMPGCSKNTVDKYSKVKKERYTPCTPCSSKNSVQCQVPIKVDKCISIKKEPTTFSPCSSKNAAQCQVPIKVDKSMSVKKEPCLNIASCTPCSAKNTVHIQVPIKVDKCEEVQETFFGTKRKNDASRLADCTRRHQESEDCICLGNKQDTPLEIFDDDTWESVGSGSCASAQAQYYHNKLLATLQILQNKEETIRVQGESLSEAETRITSLTARTHELKKQIDKKNCQIQTLRQTIENYNCNKNDASIITDHQDVDSQKMIVKTLRNNLSVIEDLYRDTFYETAKQEGIIETLRQSYLDVQMLDRERDEQINKLQGVIYTQKCSLDRCQDIANDVDNLKIEISNFINNSSNDSGVWEECVVGSVTEDLHDIAAQLLLLRELLTNDCTCGLQAENIRLKQNNDCLTNQIEQLQQKISNLERIIENKETVERQLEKQIQQNDRQLHLLSHKLSVLEDEKRECSVACNSTAMQLQQTQVLLENKSSELCQLQTKCRQYEEALKCATEECSKCENLNKENSGLRNELSESRRECCSLRGQLSRLHEQCNDLQECVRAERARTLGLESEARAAARRGAALCACARRAVASVRGWARAARDKHREQEEEIIQKECQLRCLQQKLLQKHSDPCWQPNETCLDSPKTCSRYQPCSARGRPPCNNSRASEMKQCTKCTAENCRCGRSASAARARPCREAAACTSASEMDCVPAPPPRITRKRSTCNQVCVSRDACVQRPLRRDAACCARGDRRLHTLELWSPGEELFSRVEGAGAALSHALRRWRAPPSPSPSPAPAPAPAPRAD